MPPYDVGGSSQCATLPHYRDHDGYPMRSPLVVSDFLIERLQASAALHDLNAGATSYAEIGTRDGDNIACVAQLARRAGLRVSATGVEQSARRCEALRVRSTAAGDIFRVIEAQVNETSHLHTLPVADVYYYWGMSSTNLQMARWVDEALHHRGARGTLYMGYDWHYPADRNALVPHVQAFRATKGNSSVALKRLFFDESDGREEFDEPPTEALPVGASTPQERDTPRRRPPSYTRPFARRPGQWGVFHIVSLQVGAGTLRIPRTLERQVAREMA